MSRSNTQYHCVLVATNLLFAVVLMASVPTSSQATVIPPIGLAPGSPYQLIFVTADLIIPTSSDISYYNSFVTAEAADNPSLPTATWCAVASTQTMNANANAVAYNNIPIYNAQGALVATGYTDLWDGTIESPIEFNQYGGTDSVSRDLVWTGSDTSGFSKPNHYLPPGPAFSTEEGNFRRYQWQLDRGSHTNRGGRPGYETPLRVIVRH